MKIERSIFPSAKKTKKGIVKMKATGIVRRIDDLGRVVIPKEIRRTMRIREGDPLEIYTDREGEVIFKKYSPIGELAVFAVPMAAAAIMPLVLTAFGTISLTSAYATWLAYFLMGAACIAIGTFVSALTENQIIAYLATFGALLICYLMNGIKSLFTSGNTLAFIVFCVVLAVVALLVGLACKNVTVGSAVFCGGAVVLVLLFKLRPAWLLTGFNSVLGALALFQPFTDFVGGMFSVTGIVYYLSVAGLFLFLTGQALERRRWN